MSGTSKMNIPLPEFFFVVAISQRTTTKQQVDNIRSDVATPTTVVVQDGFWYVWSTAHFVL